MEAQNKSHSTSHSTLRVSDSMGPVSTVCQNCKKNFTIEPEDFSFYEKMKVPPPTFCFDCRLKRKLAFINERTLFKRKCDKCSKDIISMYSLESPYKVFCVNCYNDREDCTKYGTDFSFSRTFFEQFFELFEKVPKSQFRQRNNNEGCEYSNHSFYSRNIYLSYTVIGSEDIYYSKQVHGNDGGNRICIDCLNIIACERGYELINSSKSYNSRFLVNSSQCVDSTFLFNCTNCTDCFMSSNLRNKSYVFRNQQLSREQYLGQMASLSFDSYLTQEELKKEFLKLCKNTLCIFANIKNSYNCTGDSIENSKNTFYSFGLVDAENSKYIFFDNNILRDSYDLAWTGKNQSCYELTDAGSGNNHLMFSIFINAAYDSKYCISSDNSNNMFGCVGLVNKSYCILNKQYTKEEYESLIPRIIKHMNDLPYINKQGISYRYGEFFPTELSPFAYNESLAYEEFPMKQSDVLDHGYKWRDFIEKTYLVTIESNNLPDRLSDVSDDVLTEVIACPNKGQVETKCSSAYRITPNELRFCRLMKIPLPRFCPNCRYCERKKWRNPYKLWRRKCMKPNCPNEFETSYAPDRPEIVYCEKCYQQEVY